MFSGVSKKRVCDTLSVIESILSYDAIRFQRGIPEYTDCLLENWDGLDITWRSWD